MVRKRRGVEYHIGKAEIPQKCVVDTREKYLLFNVETPNGLSCTEKQIWKKHLINTTDTDKTLTGERNDTATPQMLSPTSFMLSLH